MAQKLLTSLPVSKAATLPNALLPHDGDALAVADWFPLDVEDKEDEEVLLKELRDGLGEIVKNGNKASRRKTKRPYAPRPSKKATMKKPSLSKKPKLCATPNSTLEPTSKLPPSAHTFGAPKSLPEANVSLPEPMKTNQAFAWEPAAPQIPPAPNHERGMTIMLDHFWFSVEFIGVCVSSTLSSTSR